MFVIFGALGAVGVAAVVSVAALTRDIRLKRRLRKMAVTRTADVKESAYVHVAGVIELLNERVTSPVSETECACYHMWAEELREVMSMHGTPLNQWFDAGQQQEACSFLVRDASGTILIRPSDGDGFAFLAAHHEYSRHTENKLRTHEAALTEGDEVHVYGRAVAVALEDARHVAGGYRDRHTFGLTLTSAGHAPLIISTSHQNTQ